MSMSNLPPRSPSPPNQMSPPTHPSLPVAAQINTRHPDIVSMLLQQQHLLTEMQNKLTLLVAPFQEFAHCNAQSLIADPVTGKASRTAILGTSVAILAGPIRPITSIGLDHTYAKKATTDAGFVSEKLAGCNSALMEEVAESDVVMARSFSRQQLGVPEQVAEGKAAGVAGSGLKQQVVVEKEEQAMAVDIDDGAQENLEEVWDGASTELKVGIKILRNQVKQFMALYGDRTNTNMVVTKGGATEQSKSKKVSFEI